MSQRLRVAILFGGRSAEHEISILSARFIFASLDRKRFEPVLIGIDREGHWRVQDEALLLSEARDPRLLKINTATESVSLTSVGHDRAELTSRGSTLGAVDV